MSPGVSETSLVVQHQGTYPPTSAQRNVIKLGVFFRATTSFAINPLLRTAMEQQGAVRRDVHTVRGRGPEVCRFH